MLIKKLYKDLQKRFDLFSEGNLETAFSVYPNVFIICQCEFFESINNKLVIKVYIKSKETLSGVLRVLSGSHTINRNLTEKEKNCFNTLIRGYFKKLPEQKLIYIYE